MARRQLVAEPVKLVVAVLAVAAAVALVLLLSLSGVVFVEANPVAAAVGADTDIAIRPLMSS